MKKLGLLIFAAAIVIGVLVSSYFSIGQASGPFFSFSFGKKVKGSGNVTSEKREISGFSGVDVGGIFQVDVTANGEFGVEVTADDNLLPHIRTEVRNNILFIETDKRLITGGVLKVIVSAPDIENIETSGASRVNVTGVENRGIRIESSGASKVGLSGETGELFVDINGASSVDSSGLRASTAEVDASGASKATVAATQELKLRASGASKILYSGNAEKIEKRSSGASSIDEL
ncbi:MAG TPA: head GIN domain-containing protein [Pyrinomonadaceae bacterium]|nr:head GIN domain-containing protein [Pyrinomonadaceae bacterium]